MDSLLDSMEAIVNKFFWNEGGRGIFCIFCEIFCEKRIIWSLKSAGSHIHLFVCVCVIEKNTIITLLSSNKSSSILIPEYIS